MMSVGATVVVVVVVKEEVVAVLPSSRVLEGEGRWLRCGGGGPFLVSCLFCSVVPNGEGGW